jgi:hypothetical protein
MDKVKKIYVDSRFRTNGSVSNSDFKFELNEAIDLPDNTVCYVDDISIPHSWHTIEQNRNNTLYMVTTHFDDPVWYHTLALDIPGGNYNGITLAAAIQSELQEAEPNMYFTCVYNTSRGTVTIESNNVLIFNIISDDQLTLLLTDPNVVWKDKIGNDVSVDPNNLHSLNEVLRYTNTGFYHPLSTPAVSEFESEFLDLLTIHNIYMHCPNLGHFNSVGVRGENSIIKKIPVSSGYGYQILDSVVSPHDKMDVSRQNIKTLHFILKDVYGNVIDLHGSNYSFSLVFVTIE